MTDLDGIYRFHDTDPTKTYRIQIHAPYDASFTLQYAAASDTDSDANDDGLTGWFNGVGPNDVNRDIDAGIVMPNRGYISGQVWTDTDGNGQRDDGEPPVGDLHVVLVDEQGYGVEHLTTDSDGAYLFGPVYAGNYRVRFEAGHDQEFTDLNAAPPDKDNDATPDGTTALLTLQAGASLRAIDAGIRNLPLWFRPRVVTYSDAETRTIYSDDGSTEYNASHWLDNEPNGVPDGNPELQYPLLFVRNKEVTIPEVILSPLSPINANPSDYRLVGTVTFASQNPGIVLSSGGGAAYGTEWRFTNLSAGASKFTGVGYDPQATIRWMVERINDPSDYYNAGRSINPTYVTYAEVQAPMPIGFKLLRTFVHLGCAAAAGVTSESNVIDTVWSKFQGSKVATWDGKPLVYYQDWLYRDLSELQYTTSGGLVRNLTGECTSFVRLMIDALRAQGVERSDDVYVVWGSNTISNGVFREFMFVGRWQATNPVGTLYVPALPDHRWVNSSTSIEVGKRYGWKWSQGWGYDWNLRVEVPPAANSAAGQNNPNPLGIFGAHALVKLQKDGKTVLYDPSYGNDYKADDADAALLKWENENVSYYGYRFEPILLPGVPQPNVGYLVVVL